VHLLSIILLGIAANLDNLGIGLAYGIRRVKISLVSNLIIALLSGIATSLASFTGHLLNRILPDYLGNVIGGCIVGAVGVWVIAANFNGKNTHLALDNSDNEQMNNTNAANLRDIIRQPEKADVDYSGHISVKESILLGTALSINCLDTGLGAGMTGLSVIGTTSSECSGC